MRYVDAHIHLSDPAYNNKISEVLDEAKQSGVAALVSNSMDLETSILNLQLAQKNGGSVYAALGVHPWNIQNLRPNELEKTLSLISQHKENRGEIVAVGEIGLDPQYAKHRELRESQANVFTEMLASAEKSGLPVIVHSRWSAPEIMNLLPSFSLRGVLFHWFSSPPELLPKIVERGYCVSEGPPALYSRRIRDVVRRVPLRNLLTETDGPVRYMGRLREQLTTPALIPLVVKAIAEIKAIKEGDVADQVLRNFVNFFEIEELASQLPR